MGHSSLFEKCLFIVFLTLLGSANHFSDCLSESATSQEHSAGLRCPSVRRLLIGFVIAKLLQQSLP